MGNLFNFGTATDITKRQVKAEAQPKVRATSSKGQIKINGAAADVLNITANEVEANKGKTSEGGVYVNLVKDAFGKGTLAIARTAYAGGMKVGGYGKGMSSYQSSNQLSWTMLNGSEEDIKVYNVDVDAKSMHGITNGGQPFTIEAALEHGIIEANGDGYVYTDHEAVAQLSAMNPAIKTGAVVDVYYQLVFDGVEDKAVRTKSNVDKSATTKDPVALEADEAVDADDAFVAPVNDFE